MITNTKLIIRPARASDRQQLATLIHFEAHVHRHLDWRPPLEWIGHDPYLVAEDDGRILGALVCPPELSSVAWIRLFAVSGDWDVVPAWDSLWAAARDELRKSGPVIAAAIPLQGWFRERLESSQFELIHNVVLLQWQQSGVRPPRKNCSITVRPMNFDDLQAVTAVDAASFGRLWQNTYESLHLAFQQSAVATVAEDQSSILGYQISTVSPMGGHLARLAVLPEQQSRGIGYCLVDDMLDQFQRRGVTRVTVNTQHDNAASLSLYLKAGFDRTGEFYPVYQHTLE